MRVKQWGHRRKAVFGAAVSALIGSAASPASATEGALGRPISGMSVLSGVGIVSPDPMMAVSVQQIYVDGSIGASRQVPIAGKSSLGIEAPAAFTLATILKGWGGVGGWDFASAVTIPFLWTETTARFSVGRLSTTESDRTSNLFDLYFTPLIAGYHFSQYSHIALSFNFWAPTGHYDQNALANTSLNNWTFVPQVAYTQLFPQYGIEMDVVASLQFYTKNTATNYQNAPLFTVDVMGLKRFRNGVGVGIVAGTVQQLGNDSGPLADRLNGFVGRDFALGPIVTYDTKLNGKLPLSASIRWVPTIASTNRVRSTRSFMATMTVAF
jgi:hypothetical protein